MEIKMNKKAMEAERQFASAPMQIHLRAEAMAAGAGRDNVEILLKDARIFIKSAETETGRVLAEGECVCQAAYLMNQETAARAVEAVAPVSCQIDVPGALGGMTGEVTACVDEVQAEYQNGHIVFDVYATVSSYVTALVPLEVISETGAENALETRYEDVKSVKLSAENAVGAYLTETVSLPSALDARYVLMEWAQPMQVDFQKEPGGLRVTGNVLFETLISTGLKQRPVQLVKYRLPIDKFLEMPEWLMENVHAEAEITNLKAQVKQAENGEDAALTMEADVKISAFAMGEDTARALTDAFSVSDTRVQAEKAEYEVCLGVNRLNVKEPFRSSVLLKEGTGAAGEVLAVKTHAAVGDIMHEGARTTVMGVINCQVVYMTGSGDKLRSESADLPFEVSVAAETGGDARFDVVASAPEASWLMSDRIEMKCTINVSVRERLKGTMTVVKDVTENGKSEKKNGIVIVWPTETDDEWSVAKRYLTRVENVKNASGGSLSRQNPLVIRL